MSCGIGRRSGLDPMLLWLWRSPVATAPIRPLAWEPPYAEGVAQEMAKRQKIKTKVGRSLLVQQVKDLALSPAAWVATVAQV